MKIILFLLKIFAKSCIKKHNPKIIGITGSAGKTSTSNYIFQFLKNKYGEEVYISPYNYNGEFGLPLTILQQKSGFKNPFKWLKIFINSIFIIYKKSYPKIIILEYGVDHIGEMDYLLEIAIPEIAIILNISENHIEQFKTLENIITEKLKIVQKSKKIIFNIDDENLKDLNGQSYGKRKESLFQAKNIISGVGNISFDLVYENKTYNLEYRVIGEYQVYSILPIFAIGVDFGMEIEEIINLSKDIYSPAGRGTILKGKNESIIIDGSYNGGFNPILAGLKYLSEINNDYTKIVLLGDMRELGEKQEEFHKKLTNEILKTNFDYYFFVGPLLKQYSSEILINNFGNNKVFYFLDSRQAGKKINEILETQNKKSLIFVKGSQNTIFLEESIKKFCLEGEKTKLVRQSKRWMKIKEKFFSNLK